MFYESEYFVDRPQAHTQEPGCPRCHSYRTRKSRCARAEKYGVIFMLWLCSCSETCRWRSRWGLSQARANHPQKEAAFRVCTHYPNTLAQKGQNPHRGELGKERHAAGEALHKSPWRRKAEKASPLSQSYLTPRYYVSCFLPKVPQNKNYFSFFFELTQAPVPREAPNSLHREENLRVP